MEAKYADCNSTGHHHHQPPTLYGVHDPNTIRNERLRHRSLSASERSPLMNSHTPKAHTSRVISQRRNKAEEEHISRQDRQSSKTRGRSQSNRAQSPGRGRSRSRDKEVKSV